jgi:hypothetical protein
MTLSWHYWLKNIIFHILLIYYYQFYQFINLFKKLLEYHLKDKIQTQRYQNLPSRRLSSSNHHYHQTQPIKLSLLIYTRNFFLLSIYFFIFCYTPKNHHYCHPLSFSQNTNQNKLYVKSISHFCLPSFSQNSKSKSIWCKIHKWSFVLLSLLFFPWPPISIQQTRFFSPKLPSFINQVILFFLVQIRVDRNI